MALLGTQFRLSKAFQDTQIPTGEKTDSSCSCRLYTIAPSLYMYRTQELLR